MLLIHCPNCGDRDESEFTHGGPERTWPEMDGTGTPEAWRASIHGGLTPVGPLKELWYHAGGCETWVTVARDRDSHALSGESG